MEEWSVILYWNRKRAKLVARSPLVFFNASLNVWTALSARPFVEGWYAVHFTCLIPLREVKVWNSLLVKVLPLSVTNILGSPCVENTWRKNWMVFLEVVEGMIAISGHLEWASTRMTNIFPWKGPAKLT